MFLLRCALPLLFLFACNTSAPRDVHSGATEIVFDAETAGSLFTAVSGDWKVVDAGERGRVLAQLAKNRSAVFNVALLNGIEREAVDIRLSFRALAGEIDQGGGPVWRALDAQNYYIARYNPLEDNLRVYTVVQGVRTELASANIPNSPGWHTLRVAMVGNQIECFYDDEFFLKVTDGTFPGAGQLGLWTKADAQTQFDDVLIR